MGTLLYLISAIPRAYPGRLNPQGFLFFFCSVLRLLICHHGWTVSGSRRGFVAIRLEGGRPIALLTRQIPDVACASRVPQMLAMCRKGWAIGVNNLRRLLSLRI
jgi:hypothetical protein